VRPSAPVPARDWTGAVGWAAPPEGTADPPTVGAVVAVSVARGAMTLTSEEAGPGPPGVLVVVPAVPVGFGSVPVEFGPAVPVGAGLDDAGVDDEGADDAWPAVLSSGSGPGSASIQRAQRAKTLSAGVPWLVSGRSKRHSTVEPQISQPSNRWWGQVGSAGWAISWPAATIWLDGGVPGAPPRSKITVTVGRADDGADSGADEDEPSGPPAVGADDGCCADSVTGGLDQTVDAAGKTEAVD